MSDILIDQRDLAGEQALRSLDELVAAAESAKNAIEAWRDGQPAIGEQMVINGQTIKDALAYGARYKALAEAVAWTKE